MKCHYTNLTVEEAYRRKSHGVSQDGMALYVLEASLGLQCPPHLLANVSCSLISL